MANEQRTPSARPEGSNASPVPSAASIEPRAPAPADPRPRDARLADDLLARIRDRTARVGIMGMGYVGLPLALEFARAGFDVVGFDVDLRHVEGLRAGSSPIVDVPDADLREALATGRLQPTASAADLEAADAVLICVPTPLSKTRQPDMGYIEAALATLLPRMGRRKLVVLESTTYPGTTDEFLLGALTDAGLREGEDVLLAFSSERVDPGNLNFPLRAIPKVVGGVTRASGDVAEALYAAVFERVHRVSSARVAELSKLLENTFRNVNIALVNEFKQICDTLDVDVWEVIEAARTKPFGFMPFYPGPGIGGHCIPLDPQYLVYKARLTGFEPRLVTLADQINMEMPRYTAVQVMELLNRRGRAMRGARVLALGVTYKPDIPDQRESPAQHVIEELLKRGAEVRFVDPFVERLTVGTTDIPKVAALTDAEVERADAVVILTAHRAVDLRPLAGHGEKIIDTRNAMARVQELPNAVVG